MKKSRTTIRNKLDKQWAIIIRQKGRCEVCGKESYLNAHHFYSRSALSTRWDLDNGFCLCTGCHVFSSKFSAHKTPADFVDWAVKQRGKDWLDMLRDRHNLVVKYSDFDLMIMLEQLQSMQK